MQVQIGEKIKELRKRDSRKQEDLAKALGVTAQAVSRWESGGCYPDMGMLPAIANFFHVSIDSLFGYSNDREEKIQELTRKYNRFFIDNDMSKTDLSPVIDELRACLNEFPDEPELLRLLALTLSSQGQKENEKPNRLLEEAASIFEKLLEKKYRTESVILGLLNAYTAMGCIDKAEDKAKEQLSLQTSREVLLASIQYDGGKEAFSTAKEQKYKGEEILALLHELERAIDSAVYRNEQLYASKEGLEILEALRTLFTKIFTKNDFGKFHSDMCMLSLSLAKISVKTGDNEKAFEYFDLAYGHYKEHKKLMVNSKKNGPSEDSYESAILKEAGETYTPIAILRPDYLNLIFSSFPKDVQKRWLEKSGYAGDFDENVGPCCKEIISTKKE